MNWMNWMIELEIFAGKRFSLSLPIFLLMVDQKSFYTRTNKHLQLRCDIKMSCGLISIRWILWCLTKPHTLTRFYSLEYWDKNPGNEWSYLESEYLIDTETGRSTWRYSTKIQSHLRDCSQWMKNIFHDKERK